MFTGIIEGMGTIMRVEDRETTRRFFISAPSFAGEIGAGDSVAVDGACLTVVELEGDAFSVDVIGTTLERTLAGSYREGSPVNLERAVRVGDRLDGHIVQGHVDGVGHVMEVIRDGEFWRMDFRIPREVADYTILHGSITLNGVSLTVSDFREDDVIQIGIIPFTWTHTNLGRLTPGDPVNVEGDLIGKYVGKIMAKQSHEGTHS
ncbi:MAG: riboflavin synthase [Gemmatimonadota bacterium]